MNVVHCIEGLPEAAGTTTFVGYLSEELVRLGNRVSIVVRCFRSSVDYIPKGVELIVSDLKKTLLLSPEVVHLHGLWNPWMYLAFRWACSQRCKIVWSPHGALTPWAFHYKWWKKLPVWWLYQKRALKGADLLHVTTPAEVEDVRRLGLSQPVVIAPLGVEVESARVLRQVTAVKRALFISRVHPKKGLHNLIEAWAILKPRDWILEIAGPSYKGYAEEIMELARERGVGASVKMLGSVFGDQKKELYAKADLFILPTYSENFGVVVVEALAQGCPVITTKGAPWQSLEEQHCGWWIDIGVEPLVQCLRKVLSLPQESFWEMGERGRTWVQNVYSWANIAKQMLEAYKEIGK